MRRLTPPVAENSLPPVPPSAPRATEIALAGMQFHVLVGVLPHEREHPQPLEVDLRVGLIVADGVVLDYRDLYALVRRVVDAAPHDYLETIAEGIVAAALARPPVAWVRAAVRKPHVALGGPLAHAEVVVEGAR